MDALLPEQPIAIGFGSDPLSPHPKRPVEIVGDTNRDRLQAKLRESCPRVPGVYGMLDRKGDLIYVGKSKSLRSRLMSYFSASNAQEKGGRIIEATRAIQWETQPSEFASLLREQHLIRRHSPRWNVQGVPKRQKPVYLCLGRQPAMFFLSNKPPANVASGLVAVEGPFFGAGRMKTAVDALNKTFKLRDCSSKTVFHFAEQLELFQLEYRAGCLRFETETCLGPCAAGCTRRDYERALNVAESFMDGFNHEPILMARESFERAMQNRQYELASRFHATLDSLEYVERKLSMLATARRTHTFVYSVSGFDGCDTWYLVHCGEIVDAHAVPKNHEGTPEVGQLMRRWSKTISNRLDRGHGPHPHTLAIVASWFRKNRGEFHQTFDPTSAVRLSSPKSA
jgi:excinuclease ABC subunit C